jgi:RNase H-like domain found in reverse transcriptase
MQGWPTLKNVKELRGFLGLPSYYKKFIKNYGIISKLLTKLLKKNYFQWSPSATLAFDELKQAMSSASVLAMPDFTKEFVLETDASDKGLGAVLMQNRQPIVYLSKALGIKGQAMSTYEKELMALLTVVGKWRHYFQDKSFIIKTDHISLNHLLEQRLTYTLQHMGLCKLLGFDYVVQYKKGVENRAADALSRRPTKTIEGAGFAISEIVSTWL